jgi:hypothetical protein
MLRILVAAMFAGGLLSVPAFAEEDLTPKKSVEVDPNSIDRDGKRICGFELMTDSEKGGYRAMMHANKALADRDAIRVEHCNVMKKRAAERGVELKE